MTRVNRCVWGFINLTNKTVYVCPPFCVYTDFYIPMSPVEGSACVDGYKVHDHCFWRISRQTQCRGDAAVCLCKLIKALSFLFCLQEYDPRMENLPQCVEMLITVPLAVRSVSQSVLFDAQSAAGKTEVTCSWIFDLSIHVQAFVHVYVWDATLLLWSCCSSSLAFSTSSCFRSCIGDLTPSSKHCCTFFCRLWSQRQRDTH